MKNRIESFTSKPNWFAGLVLVVVLYLMYSPTFLVDYLMNDEWRRIGKQDSFMHAATISFFFFGRGLVGVYEQLIYRFVGYDPTRVQFVRFLYFASMAAVAVILLRFIKKRSQNGYFAFFVILLLFSQPSFQGMVGYSLTLISFGLASIWLSLLAFYLYFFVFDAKRLPKLLQAVIVFLILSLAMQSTQTFAFFAMLPLSYLILCDWEERRKRAWSFLLISLLALLFSVLVYKIGLEIWHAQGKLVYELGEQALEAAASKPAKVLLKAINPLSYWSAFKVWSYPFPLHNLPRLGESKMTIASFVMALWVALVLGAIITEFRSCLKGTRHQILLKWLTILGCLGLGAVFLVIDSPQEIIEHRPHITTTLTGVVIFAGAYSLQVLAKYPLLKSELTKALGAILVLMIAFGAQAGVLRGIVNNRMEQVSFIRTELMAASPSDYDNIIVVLPTWRGCVTEPCEPWMGSAPTGKRNMTAKGVYRYALATIGISPDTKSITFVEQKPSPVPQNSVIIDWDKYASARERYSENLYQNDWSD